MSGRTYLSFITIFILYCTHDAVESKDFYLGTRYGKRDEYQQAIKPIPLNQAFARFLDISIEIPERQREILLDRYSRSNQQAAPIEVSPRNDRFFMGTRYGKRNDESVDTGRENEDLRAMGLECQHSTNGQRILECNRRRLEIPPNAGNLRNEDPVLSYANDQILT